MTQATEVEQLRKQIREKLQELKSREEAEAAVEQTSTTEAVEPLEMSDLLLWFAVILAVLLSTVWLSVWALIRLLRAVVRGTSAAWHEGASKTPLRRGTD